MDLSGRDGVDRGQKPVARAGFTVEVTITPPISHPPDRLPSHSTRLGS